MYEVAVIGAGDLGGTTAHRLARRDVATRIRLVDEREHVAEGKALDIMQAAAIERFSTEVVASVDVRAAGGADLFVLADRAGGGEWLGDVALQLVRRLADLAPAAVLICAGSSARELVDRAVRELHIHGRRIIGSAPEAMASRVRALVALALDRSPQDVMLTVVGNPPSQTVIPWDDAALGGYQLTRLVAAPVRQRIAERAATLGPSGPHALAAAAVKAAEGVRGRALGTVSCFVAPDGIGARARATALPVRLNGQGVEAIVLPQLNAVDRVSLENVMVR